VAQAVRAIRGRAFCSISDRIKVFNSARSTRKPIIPLAAGEDLATFPFDVRTRNGSSGCCMENPSDTSSCCERMSDDFTKARTSVSFSQFLSPIGSDTDYASDRAQHSFSSHEYGAHISTLSGNEKYRILISVPNRSPAFTHPLHFDMEGSTAIPCFSHLRTLSFHFREPS
jgi:hypothetical protein